MGLPSGNRLKRMESREELLLMLLLTLLSLLLPINLQISYTFLSSHFTHLLILPSLSKCTSSSIWPDQLLRIHLAGTASQEYDDSRTHFSILGQNSAANTAVNNTSGMAFWAGAMSQQQEISLLITFSDQFLVQNHLLELNSQEYVWIPRKKGVARCP